MRKVVCEGCGKITDEYKEVGFLKSYDYCPGCIPDVEKYIEERDKLHTELAKKFETGNAKLRTKYRVPEGI